MLIEYAKRGAALSSHACLGFLRYGRNAPIPLEPLYKNPQDIKLAFKPKPDMDTRLNAGGTSGLILGGDWDTHVRSCRKTWKFRAVVAHFRDGKSWEETGIIDRMMQLIEERGVFDKLDNRADVVKRYERLDRVYDEIVASGRLKTRRELRETFWGERGGIYGHIDRNGNFLRFRNGNHRFAMAICAGLTEVPVRLGVVHPDAVKAGVIRRMRKRVVDQ